MQRVHDHASAAGTLDKENNAVNVPDGWVRYMFDACVIDLTSAGNKLQYMHAQQHGSS
jgi:hypothetical protein